MDIALVTEGTYPHNFGGVSVWSDQLIRGLGDHRFHVVALVATGCEQLAWELPHNVASVKVIPLWGEESKSPRIGRVARQRFLPLFKDFLEVILAPVEPDSERFGIALRALFEYAQVENLCAALQHEDALALLIQIWRQSWLSEQGKPTLHDALTWLQLLEHSLRAFALPPVQTQLTHCVSNGLAALPALAAKWVYGTPILLTEHGIYLREQYLGFRESPYRWPVKAMHLAFLRRVIMLAYREASMITPGNIYNQRWEEQLGANLATIRTVYNGVDPDAFPPVQGEPPVPTISWAGRIAPIKDIETLIRGFALVLNEIPTARLRLFGGAPAGGEEYLDRCRSLTNKLGLGSSVTFEGRIEQIRDAYAAGHVVVLSSISEGFPYTVIEAMTCGRPCVATDVGGVSEAIADTGLVVPPRDPEALAQACIRLLRDKDLSCRLGNAARVRALEHFTVGKTINSFQEIYLDLIDQREHRQFDEVAARRTLVTMPHALLAKRIA